MKIHGNQLLSDVSVDGKNLSICEFNKELTKKDIKRYQLQLMYAEEIYAQVQKTVDEPHIAQVFENLKTLHQMYDKYIVDLFIKTKGL